MPQTDFVLFEMRNLKGLPSEKGANEIHWRTYDVTYKIENAFAVHAHIVYT